jgi:hypothetical protein
LYWVVVCLCTVPLPNWVVVVVVFAVGGTAFNAVGSWTTLTGGLYATGSVSEHPRTQTAATPMNAAITSFVLIVFMIAQLLLDSAIEENASDVPREKRWEIIAESSTADSRFGKFCLGAAGG